MNPNHIPHLQIDAVLRAMKDGCCLRHNGHDRTWRVCNEHGEVAGVTIQRIVDDLHSSKLIRLQSAVGGPAPYPDIRAELTEKGRNL